MKKTYICLQPKYVSQFKCDGQSCQAWCCRNWRISIDDDTYKKYSKIKPKKAAEEITKHIERNSEWNCYMVQLDEKASCPMLTKDNWCKIQKTYGEKFLSITCTTYPRITYNFENFFERSLTLTCPVVAKMVLTQTEPMEFEQVEISGKILNSFGKISIKGNPVPNILWNYFPFIQSAAIKILQARNLSLDNRLALLGLFLDKLDEIFKGGSTDELKKVTEIYSSENFLTEQAPLLIPNIEFNPVEHMRLISNTFEALFGGDEYISNFNRIFIKAITYSLNLIPDENNQLSLKKMVESYNELADFRKKFLDKFSTVFENYLVNEFFLNVYPYKLSDSIVHNYGAFLTVYKMLELTSLSVAVQDCSKENLQNPVWNEENLLTCIQYFSQTVDHNRQYMKKIFEQLKDKNDMLEIMQNLLQT